MMTSTEMPIVEAEAAAKAAAALKAFAIEAWTLFGVGLLVTILRTYHRVRTTGIARLQVDDYLVWVAAIFYAAETALAHQVGYAAKGLANNGMTDDERRLLMPDDPEYHLRVLGSKIQIAGWTCYTTLLWLLKAALLAFYTRLTAGLGRSYPVRIKIGFCFIIVSYVTVILNIYLSCRPFPKFWQIEPNPGNVCQPAMSNQIIWVCLAFNVSTDLYLLTIPGPMLWNSGLRLWKKLGLILLLSGGIFVIACAILRCVLIVADPINGAQLAGSWAVRETFVAVVTTNFPMVFQLFKTWVKPIIGSVSTSMSSHNKLSNGTPNERRTIGGGGGSGPSWRGRGPPTANPITNFTLNESEEMIMMDSMIDQQGRIQKQVEVAVTSEEVRGNEMNTAGSATNAEPWTPSGNLTRVQGNSNRSP